MDTRTDEKSKSVIDYILVDHQSETAVEEMVIDEDKEFAPMTTDSVFSDHNVMFAKFNWLVLQKSCQDHRKITTKKGYLKIAEELEETKVSEILDRNMDLQSCYDMWKNMVEEIEERHKTVVKKKNPRKTIKLLIREKKALKQKMRKQNKEERANSIKRVKEISQAIIEESNSQFKNKIKKVVEELRSENGINGPNVWEVLKRVKRKTSSNRTAIKDKDGLLLEDTEAIKSRYQEHFVDILQPPKATTLEEESRKVDRYCT